MSVFVQVNSFRELDRDGSGRAYFLHALDCKDESLTDLQTFFLAKIS